MVRADVTTGISLVVICGPTGSGKGRLARGLAGRLDGEVVSADSRKIYRGFDIGTAKASREARETIPHHLIDVCPPHEVFTTGRFMELADQAIEAIHARGRLPIVAGGTGLYIRTLLHGIVEAPPRDESLRSRLLDEEADDPGALHRRLRQVDPGAAGQIPPADLVRTVRALEVHALTGKRLSDLQSDHRFQPNRYRALRVAPDWPRDELHARIDSRVDRMMDAGWLAEVAELRRLGHERCPAFESVGYRQLRDHLDGRSALEEAVESIKTEHRRYARRQLVWFRAEKDVQWLPAPVDEEGLVEKVRVFLSSD